MKHKERWEISEDYKNHANYGAPITYTGAIQQQKAKLSTWCTNLIQRRICGASKGQQCNFNYLLRHESILNVKLQHG